MTTNDGKYTFVSHQENMNQYYTVYACHISILRMYCMWVYYTYKYSLYRNGSGCSCNSINAFLIILRYAITMIYGWKRETNVLCFSPVERAILVINENEMQLNAKVTSVSHVGTQHFTMLWSTYGLSTVTVCVSIVQYMVS